VDEVGGVVGGGVGGVGGHAAWEVGGGRRVRGEGNGQCRCNIWAREGCMLPPDEKSQQVEVAQTAPALKVLPGLRVDHQLQPADVLPARCGGVPRAALRTVYGRYV